MTCLELIVAFLKNLEITEESYKDVISKIKKQNVKDDYILEYDEGIKYLYSVLIDIYSLNSENVKMIANRIAKNHEALGRAEKDLIKHYCDYSDEESFNKLIKIIGQNYEQEILMIFESYSVDLSSKAINKFKENWLIADDSEDQIKKFDYIQGLYSRISTHFNSDKISLDEIYKYNEPFISKELKEDSIIKLKKFCSSNEKIDSKMARRSFCDFYSNILDKELLDDSNNNKLEKIMNKSYAKNTPFYELETEKYGNIVIKISQKMYDACPEKNYFLDLVLTIISQTYRLLKNHRTLVIYIENIFDNGHNLKWELYSYIGIFAEHFIPTRELRNFYKPELLAIDKLNYLGFETTDTDTLNFKRYYSGKISKEELQNIYHNLNIDKVILDFENVWYGFTFTDCISVSSDKKKQAVEIEFIENDSELVFVFNKYRHDDRKIPCPECAGLDISGNSFPEVGLRSWECKNIICPSRSKSNRGKRYSNKSNFMQNGFEDNIDLISKDFIKKWRRDVCKIDAYNDVLEMSVRYFSFTNDNVLFINCDSGLKIDGRIISEINLSDIIKMRPLDNYFDNYFNGDYIKRFIDQIEYNKVEENQEITNLIKNGKESILVEGDSRKVLSSVNENIFTAAVTSPPYYNAREYSQWPNLYLYLSDMYEITKEIFRTMKPGGVYLYNIGDICGNENTIVRSNMGDKRILLGSYTIFIFEKAGFELLDNILWDKGEPQSNRQKNDGKFTPYYQKPMNVYEHMFIFKKPGHEIILNKKIPDVIPSGWDKNVVQFSPVIKINSKGENVLGHTAPFPSDIPDFVAKVFTNKEDDIILEPFAGSGTSIISSAKNNRRCFAIELCKDYVNLIENICNDNNVKIKKLAD